MIEKINLTSRVPYPGESQASYEIAMLSGHLTTCVAKINELIDAVNTLQATCMTYPTSAEKKRVECGRLVKKPIPKYIPHEEPESKRPDIPHDHPQSPARLFEGTPDLLTQEEECMTSQIKDPKLAEAAHEINKIMYSSYSVECSDDCTAAWDYIKQVLTEKGLI